MTLALIALATAAPLADAREYFPLEPGTRLVYEGNDKARTQSLDEVGQPETIGTTTVIPVATDSGVDSNRTYYSAQGDTIFIIAYDKKQPLPKPVPILKVGEGPVSWSFQGPIEAGKQGEVMRMDASSRPLASRSVLGKRVPVLEVRIKSKVGAIGPSIDTDQVAIYAKGIGLVELSSTVTIGENRSVTKLKLRAIKRPGEG